MNYINCLLLPSSRTTFYEKLINILKNKVETKVGNKIEKYKLLIHFKDESIYSQRDGMSFYIMIDKNILKDIDNYQIKLDDFYNENIFDRQIYNVSGINDDLINDIYTYKEIQHVNIIIENYDISKYIIGILFEYSNEGGLSPSFGYLKLKNMLETDTYEGLDLQKKYII